MTTAESPAILMDAYSQIFRSFYAIAHLSRRDGFPTNALFAFGRLLLRIETDYRPHCGAMFFDCGKPAFRLELAPDYKANRPPMPEDLKLQMPVLRELIAAFGWNSCQCENYEADDLIGAAVRSDAERGFRIISSDKDLAQLIDGRVAMLIPARTGSGFELRGAAETLERFAVRPEQMVDYLAMLGDQSDAIAGVAGVGPKTAAGILRECGSLAEFFAAPERLANPKLREKLLAARDLLERNLRLIRLRCDWPCELPEIAVILNKQTPDWARVGAIFQEYELRSLLKELPESHPVSEPVKTAAKPAAPEEEPESDLFNWRSDREKKRNAAPEPEDDLFAGWPRHDSGSSQTGAK